MDSKPHFHGHRERLRQKLKKDPRQLADYEILELVLGTVLTRCDTKPLAKELLSRFKTLHGVLHARPAELRAVTGFGQSLENQWLLLRELMTRCLESPVRERATLSGPTEIVAMARLRLGSLQHEEFWAVFLDNQNRLLAWERISTGTVNTTMIYPRDLMEMALGYKASSLVIVHNHPGGNPVPSTPDVEITRQIIRSGQALGIRVLDHIIVTEGDFYSLKDEGLV
ncbi:DNA repair protein RadC [Desulfovibrio subterraneus]|jgi:DNA repair protein RadC|uniref:DNA repair protein RadC n=1 Tax=Desulfovibrio subterraneus TaxID=2718620 RepID=A0A7J0BI17_9BACT|nr:DNA repair protein RadC [Desulfovibrio subterraneus]WBF67494.1 DNA repair protein RadC [Desulfovibrio subterraneus]GFM33327.1 DNA repair protein RadC [Desulfovibrio subterraneus]